MTEKLEFYCLRDKKYVMAEWKQAHGTGRGAMIVKGICPICNGKLSKFVKK